MRRRLRAATTDLGWPSTLAFSLLLVIFFLFVGGWPLAAFVTFCWLTRVTVWTNQVFERLALLEEAGRKAAD